MSGGQDLALGLILATVAFAWIIPANGGTSKALTVIETAMGKNGTD